MNTYRFPLWSLITCMDVLHSPEQLIQEELVMLWCEIIVRFYYLMEIGLHQLKDEDRIRSYLCSLKEESTLLAQRIKSTKIIDEGTTKTKRK